MSLLSSYRRFFQFLRKPDQGSYRRLGIAFKYQTLFSLLLLNLLFSAVWLVCYSLITRFPWMNETLNVQFFQFWMFFVTIVWLLPVVEEFLFRLPLKYERNYGLQLLVLMVGIFYESDEAEALENRVRSVWNRFFWATVYVSCSIFAFLHIFNYPDFRHLLLWFPLLTMVQFLLGMILSYIRIRLGFFWGLFYHILYNLVIFGVITLALGIHPWNTGSPNAPFRPYVQGPPDWLIQKAGGDYDFEVGNNSFQIYQVDNADYTLVIERNREIKGVPSFGVTPNKIFFDRTNVQYALRTLSNDQVTVDDPNDIQFFVELHMKKNQLSANFARNILEKELFKALDLK